MKKNCWEVKLCERQPGGHKIDELGVCPAAAEAEYDGKNGGHNAGRFCWRVAGTLCEGEIHGTFAMKAMNCMLCEFFVMVKFDEDKELVY
ncbi:hypothetical protein KKA00_02065 [bacterium]|nr:hypothetical protein [bacterium]MBU1650978.1 hypothetical protein [bacterium]MBU1880910.1 hypothetical protein [bacterium]